MKLLSALIFGLLLIAVVGWYGCRWFVVPPTSSQQEAPPQTGFKNRTAESGIDFRMRFLPNEQGETFKINLYDHGCGVAVGDYNGDGHDDIYFLNQLGPNALFRNRGDGTFEDVTAAMGVALADRICVGATFADYDNDGDQDLYVTSTRGGNVLLRNENHQQYVDVTREAGLEHVGHSQTAVFFDYDRDSLLDLYVTQTAEWTTENFDETREYYIGKDSFAATAESPKELNLLYLNRGDGTFIEVGESAGLRGLGWSSDAAVFDYDQDGWQDVLVVCMFGRAQLYRNEQDGTFRDVTAQVLGPTPYGGIGAKVFDFDNDGQLDIYIVDMHSDMWMGADYSHASLPLARQYETRRFDTAFGPAAEQSGILRRRRRENPDDPLLGGDDTVVFGNVFFKAVGQGRYVDVTQDANLEMFWPWGIAPGDFDNDGFVDLFVTAGMGYPFYYWPNYLMMNDGQQRYVNRGAGMGIEPPMGGPLLDETIRGVQPARSSRCAATADFNGDGRLEIVVNNFNHEPYYFLNDLPQANFLALKLEGTRSNRDAVGAVVRLVRGSQTLTRQVHAAGGYLSQSSLRLHFGLGPDPRIDRIEVHWPSGQRQVLPQLELNRLHRIVEPESASEPELSLQKRSLADKAFAGPTGRGHSP